MESRPCEHCGEVLPKRAQRNARFCDVTCRVAAHRARRAAAKPAVPRELASRARWVRYTARKVPVRVDGRGPASSTDASTWSSYEQAVRSCEGVGLGFVLNGDGVACVDLDHCLVDGVLAPWAQRIVDRAPGCYVERSPGGDGLHIWGFASVPQGRVVTTADGGKAEVYGWGRYITVTSRPWGDTPARLGDLTGLVSELIA